MASYRAGENAQIMGLVEALPWPYRWVELSYRSRGALQRLIRGVGLLGIDRRRSTGFSPPWPDVLVSAGLRNEPVARWVKRESRGRTRLVFLGRTWAALEHFDLVITTPQYRLPVRDNVLHNPTTLHRVTPSRLAEEGAAWRADLGALPQPRIGVLLGGDSGPHPFRARAAALLGRLVNARAQSMAGSVLVTTSARTHPDAVRAFEEALGVPAYVYRWRPDAGGNPYFALLALADELVVTGDSIAMLSEAMASGKPVYIFDLDLRRYGASLESTLKSRLYRGLMRVGPRRLSRDISIVHERLVREGRAAWLGDAWVGADAPRDEAIVKAVERVRRLVA
ncbi:MAG: ELM1/GtrOC1 family putative glycosyltransferase [Gammaproteobacteria bacterium]|jgi:mitochondrial fission protein ELM1